MRRTKRKDQTKKSRDNVVGKILEIDDLKKVTGGGNHEDRPRCRSAQCEVCVGERLGKGEG